MRRSGSRIRLFCIPGGPATVRPRAGKTPSSLPLRHPRSTLHLIRSLICLIHTMLHLPVSLILAVIVAFAGIVPPLYQSRPGRYCLHLFLHYLVVGLLVFTLTLPALPWWTQGAVIAIVMLLPLLPLPAGRGSYKWHQALLAAAVVGTALSLIKHFISDIARLFT